MSDQSDDTQQDNDRLIQLRLLIGEVIKSRFTFNVKDPIVDGKDLRREADAWVTANNKEVRSELFEPLAEMIELGEREEVTGIIKAISSKFKEHGEARIRNIINSQVNKIISSRKYLNEKRPIINVDRGSLHDNVVLAMQYMMDAGILLYTQSNILMTPKPMEQVDDGGELFEVMKLVQVDAAWITMELSRIIVWIRNDAKLGQVELAAPPYIYANSIMSAARKKPFKTISRLIGAPCLRSDMTLFDIPGYDDVSHSYYMCESNHLSGNIDIDTNSHTVEEDFGLLEDLLCEFRFVDKASLYGNVGHILTAVNRMLMDVVPGFSFTAPSANSGKTLAARLAGWIQYGRKIASTRPTKSMTEFDKQLASHVLGNSPMILLDNLMGIIDSPFLHTVITDTSHDLREFLQIKTMTNAFYNSMVTMTGNNHKFKGDFASRILEIGINPNKEETETPKFEYDPVARIMERQHEYISAAMRIVKRHHEFGCPGLDELAPSRFKEWDRFIRSAIYAYNKVDIRDCMDNIKKKEVGRNEIKDVMDLMLYRYGSVVMFTGFQLATDLEDDASGMELLRALGEISGALEKDKFNLRKLGIWIGNRDGDIIDGHKFVVLDKKVENRRTFGLCGRDRPDEDSKEWKTLAVGKAAMDKARKDATDEATRRQWEEKKQHDEAMRRAGAVPFP